MMSACVNGAEGAPSLRFLEGRVTMLPTQLSWLCNPVAHAFQVPALCKVRKGRGTHYLFGASAVKSLGHLLAKGTDVLKDRQAPGKAHPPTKTTRKGGAP